ncbi:hypothetical protein [Verrucomicrobium spinosum]|uniref:hypothetical protein n=1 Tax=Verrucomicrobium spinosum TaxID=2736 RepID=UPI0009463429|nr:hypothetical protein [Verrucomicrobium spinosum]
MSHTKARRHEAWDAKVVDDGGGGMWEQWSGGVVEWWSGGVVEWWSGGVVELFRNSLSGRAQRALST